jgi:hypothetical protein
MKQFDTLVFTADDTNKTISQKISERIKEVSLPELTEELSKQFVFQNEAIKVLYTATATNQNCILHGPGGFSKSVLVQEFFKVLNIPVVYKICHSESTVEDLLGIPNIRKMMEESKLEIAFENSVFNTPAILILDEFMDCSPTVAAALKDVLTSKGLKDGVGFKESLIASIVILGNKAPSDLTENNSLKAFYDERFPFQLEMIWKDFSSYSYLKFLKIFFKEKFETHYESFLLLAELCANTKTLVSPRIAASAGKVILDLGVDFLDTVTGIDTTDLYKVKQQALLKSCLLKEELLLKKLNDNFTECLKDDDNLSERFIECKLIIEKINNTNFSIDSLLKSGELKNRVEQHLDLKFSELADSEYSILVRKYKNLI